MPTTDINHLIIQRKHGLPHSYNKTPKLESSTSQTIQHAKTKIKRLVYFSCLFQYNWNAVHGYRLVGIAIGHIISP